MRVSVCRGRRALDQRGGLHAPYSVAFSTHAGGHAVTEDAVSSA